MVSRMFVIGNQILTGLQDRKTLEAVIDQEVARSGGEGKDGNRPTA